MSEKMTRIRLANSKSPGIMDWGEHTYEEMLEQIRNHAKYQLKQATEILTATDDMFNVDIVRGPAAQHFICKVEPVNKDKANEEIR